MLNMHGRTIPSSHVFVFVFLKVIKPKDAEIDKEQLGSEEVGGSALMVGGSPC